MAFRRRLIMKIAAASHSRSSACDLPPAYAMSCLTPREVSTGSASRLTTTSFNTCVPPLIWPYPSRHQTLLEYMPHPLEVGLYPLV
jgi:hypothetical protein